MGPRVVPLGIPILGHTIGFQYFLFENESEILNKTN
jgi:hypothetical protein